MAFVAFVGLIALPATAARGSILVQTAVFALAHAPSVVLHPAHDKGCLFMPEPFDPLMPRLREGADALGLTLSDAAQRQLLAYLAMIERWNNAYNLTAVRDPSAMLTHHLLDSLSVVPSLRRHLGPCGDSSAVGAGASASDEPARILDVGSGAGLPGVVLAIVEPQWSVTCVDAVGKKAVFVRQVAVELGLPNLRALHARIEQVSDESGFDVVTSRAFASLVDFASWTSHLLKPYGRWVAMKGRAPDEERAGLPPDVNVFHVEPLTVPELDAQRCLVWMQRRSM